jgi:hypothetical protein
MERCPCCHGKRVKSFDEYVKCFDCGGRFNPLPNLDGMNVDELAEYWSKFHAVTLEEACDAVGPRLDNVRAVETSAAYAMAKKCAMVLRAEGRFDRAQTYESHCDLYYEQLPEDLRW